MGSRPAQAGSLNNPELQLNAELKGGSKIPSEQWTSNRRRHTDDSAARQIREVESSLQNDEKQLEERRIDLARLLLVAKVAGTVLPPPEVPDAASGQGRHAAVWYGTPLEARESRAAARSPRTLLPDRHPPSAGPWSSIRPTSISFVRASGPTSSSTRFPATRSRGRSRKSPCPKLAVTPATSRTRAAASWPPGPDEASGVEPAEPLVPGQRAAGRPRGCCGLGMRGRAKVHTDWQTLGQRFWRFVTTTFHFRL